MDNKFINQLINRTTIRDFEKNHKLKSEEIEILKKIINNAPSSYNNQQFSILLVEDQTLKNIISENNFNQIHIKEASLIVLVLLDTHRQNYLLQKANLKRFEEYQLYEYTRIIVDAMISATQIHDTCLSLNYGASFFGNTLNFSDKIKQQLKMPNDTLAIVGLAIGKIKQKNALKPKIDKVFINRYDAQKSLKNLIDYDRQTQDYYQKINQKNFIDQQKQFYPQDLKSISSLKLIEIDRKLKKFKKTIT